MASTTTNMLLRKWDQLSDLYSHSILAKNFRKLDAHDHSPGRGARITTAGITDGAITPAKLAPNVGPIAYKIVAQGRAQMIGVTEGLTAVGESKFINSISYSGIFWFDPADWGLTVGQDKKLKLTGHLIASSSTLPTATYTFGLYPAGVNAGTILFGARVGAGVSVVNPQPNSMNPFSFGERIPVPPAGFYALGIVVSGASATGGPAVDMCLLAKI